MKTLHTIAAAALLAATPALAAPPGTVCIDPRHTYQATWLHDHDVVARQLIGPDHRALRLTTTCFFLKQADNIAFASNFRCLDRGDDVFTTTIDGRRQSCRVTQVAPYAG
jgi:hypothetical protein